MGHGSGNGLWELQETDSVSKITSRTKQEQVSDSFNSSQQIFLSVTPSGLGQFFLKNTMQYSWAVIHNSSPIFVSLHAGIQIDASNIHQPIPYFASWRGYQLSQGE